MKTLLAEGSTILKIWKETVLKQKMVQKLTCRRIRHRPFNMGNLVSVEDLDAVVRTSSAIAEYMFIIAILIISAADP